LEDLGLAEAVFLEAVDFMACHHPDFMEFLEEAFMAAEADFMAGIGRHIEDFKKSYM
jgi:hypothetical protein